MVEDLETTSQTLRNKQQPIEFPAVIYVESESGNIAPVIILDSEDEYTEYFWDSVVTRKQKRFSKVSDVFQMAPHSQSTAQLFFINGASDADISRVLLKASNNKKS